LRTSIFYSVGISGLALAVVLALGASVVWTYLAKRSHLREEGQERSRSRQLPPAILPRTNAPVRNGESSDAPIGIAVPSVSPEVQPRGGQSGSPSEHSFRATFTA
jgi:hypothetical protein